MKTRFVIKTLISLLAGCFIVGVTAAIAVAGNDFVEGNLRVDLPEVYNAKDYRVLLNADNQPTNSGPIDFTNGWIGVDLAQYNGQTYSGEFTQVGLVTRADGIHWFVYAEPGVTCLRGHQNYGSMGCEGDAGDLVSLGTWHWVELVTYYGQGYWIARVYDSNEVPHDVARITSSSTRIYYASSTTEEGYTVSQDPYLTASFHHWHPQYMTVNGFQDWPQSAGGNYNQIYTKDQTGQNTFCPQHYGANPNEWGDERAWFAGTGGQQCTWLLFPSVHSDLPYVRNKNTWNSTVVVRNNSSNYKATVNVTLFNSDGTVNYQRPTDTIDPRAMLMFGVPSGFDGAALATSSEDIAVVVREESGAELNEYNGSLASGGSPGWEQVGTTVYVPIVKKAYNNRTSRLFVMNAGSIATTAYLQYYDLSGNAYGSPLTSGLLAVNGSYSFDPTTCALCSAVVWTNNSQPLAVTVLEQDASTYNRSTFTAFSAGATTNFLPLIKKNYNGLWSGVAVQNLGTSSTMVSLTCYPSTGGWVPCGLPVTVQSKATAVFTLVGGADSYYGSAVATSSTGQPIATLIYENGTPYKSVTNAVLNGPSTTAYAPELYRDYPQSGQTWNSGLSIQNMGTNATVTVVYYSQAGGSPVNQWSMSLGANQSWFINKWTTYMPPAPFVGSAVIQSTQPIAVMVDTQHTGSGDTRASYTAPNR